MRFVLTQMERMRRMFPAGDRRGAFRQESRATSAVRREPPPLSKSICRLDSCIWARSPNVWALPILRAKMGTSAQLWDPVRLRCLEFKPLRGTGSPLWQRSKRVRSQKQTLQFKSGLWNVPVCRYCFQLGSGAVWLRSPVRLGSQRLDGSCGLCRKTFCAARGTGPRLCERIVYSCMRNKHVGRFQLTCALLLKGALE